MHSVHNGFSVIAPIKQGCEETVKQVLAVMNRHPGTNPWLPFSSASTTLFATLVVLPPQCYAHKTLPAQLMLATSYCGSRSHHLTELLQIGWQGLCQLFQHCTGFPPEAFTHRPLLQRYLLQHKCANTFYSGMHYINCTDVLREEALRHEIRRYLNNKTNDQAFAQLDVWEKWQNIKNHIGQLGAPYQWALMAPAYTPADWWHAHRLRLLVGAMLLLAVVGVVQAGNWLQANAWIIGISFVTVPLVLALLIHLAERQPDEPADRVPDAQMQQNAAMQMRPVMNELTACGVVKQGLLRRVIFQLVMRIAAPLTGSLHIPTVATARWIAANGGRQLIFISNYANTADAYVRDFIDYKVSAIGVNLLFGHGSGFPPTRLLAWQGALRDPETFMNVFHRSMHPTQFWYWPYPHLSVDVIKNNRAIRQGLSANFSDDEARAWLQRL